MSQERNNTEKKAGWVRELLDGTLLTKGFVVKQLPFMFYLFILAVIYIGNRNNVEKFEKQIEKLQIEIQDLRSASITISSDLIDRRKQTEIAKIIESTGLKLYASKEPPYKIVIKKD